MCFKLCALPAGLMFAGSTSTLKNFDAVKHFRGSGPSPLRYSEGRDGPVSALAGEDGAVGGDPAVDSASFALFAAAFLAAFSALFAAFLLCPSGGKATSYAQQHQA